MQSELPTDNESSVERDFFTYEPSTFHIQSVIAYCYTSFCLYLLSICIGQSHPLSEPEYQETCSHGNLVEENSNDKESDINGRLPKTFQKKCSGNCRVGGIS